MPGRALVIGTLFVTLFLLLAACDSSYYRCTDPQGCLVVPPGSPIVLAVIRASEGEQSANGNATLRGMKTAIEEKGDLLGHPIEMVSYGTDCTAERAVQAALHLAGDAQVAAVLGPTCEAEVGAIASILFNAGIVLLTPSVGPVQAYNQTYQLFDAIAQVAIQGPDQTYYIPRYKLTEILLS